MEKSQRQLEREEIATRTFRELIEGINATKSFRSHPEQVIYLVALQLFGPMYWRTEDRIEMQRVLALDPEAYQPLLERVINSLRSEALRLADGCPAAAIQEYNELLVLFQEHLTWHKINTLKHRLSLTAGVALALSFMATVGVAYTAARIFSELTKHSPTA